VVAHPSYLSRVFYLLQLHDHVLDFGLLLFFRVAQGTHLAGQTTACIIFLLQRFWLKFIEESHISFHSQMVMLISW